MDLISNFHSNLKKLEEFISVLLVILSGFFIVLVFKLNNFWTFASLDEMLWQLRSRVFWDKILQFDFSGLIQSAQPGITVYWFNGYLMKFIDFDFRDISRRIAEANANGLDFNSVVNANNPEVYRAYETISFAFNIPLFILTVIFFIAFYYLLRKLKFNQVISIFSLLFLSTTVFLYYWITPSDKMLNIFMTLSFLTMLVHLSKRKDKKYLIMSAIFGAWTVLAKLSGLFLIPFFIFLYVYYKWPISKKKIIAIVKNLSLWFFVFVIVCILFLPSIVTNPEEVVNLFKNKNIFEQASGISDYTNRIVFDYLKMFCFIFMGYMTQASVLSLLFFVYLKLNRKYKFIFEKLPKKHIDSIIGYIIMFVVMVTLTSHNHDIRFMSPVFVIINVLSAIGLYGIVETLLNKNENLKKFKSFFYIAFYFVAIIFQIIFIISSGYLIRYV